MASTKDRLIGLFRVLWFSVLGAFYIGYCLLYRELGCTFTLQSGPSMYCLVFLGVLVATPVSLVYLWANRKKMIFLDYSVVYLTLISWYLGYLAAQGWLGVGKGMGNAVFEASTVILFLNVYPIRFVLCKRWPGAGSWRTGGILYATEIIFAFLIGLWFPGWRD